MYIFDSLLIAVLAVISVFLMREFIVQMKKDPAYWVFVRTRTEYIKYWGFLEKTQPKQNTAILSFKRKRTKNKVN